MVNVQLLAREDKSVADAESTEAKWRQYIDSYVLTHPTEGLPHRTEEPFMERTIRAIPDSTPLTVFQTSSELSFRVALGNYRIFYQPNTEDYYHRVRSADEIKAAEEGEARYLATATEKLDKWIAQNLADAEAAEAAAAADEAAEAIEAEVEAEAEAEVEVPAATEAPAEVEPAVEEPAAAPTVQEDVPMETEEGEVVEEPAQPAAAPVSEPSAPTPAPAVAPEAPADAPAS